MPRYDPDDSDASVEAFSPNASDVEMDSGSEEGDNEVVDALQEVIVISDDDEEEVVRDKCEYCEANGYECIPARLHQATNSLKCTRCLKRGKWCSHDTSSRSKNAQREKQEREYNRGVTNTLKEQFRENTQSKRFAKAIQVQIKSLERQLEIKRKLMGFYMALTYRMATSFELNDLGELDRTTKLVKRLRLENMVDEDVISTNDNINEFLENFNFDFDLFADDSKAESSDSE